MNTDHNGFIKYTLLSIDAYKDEEGCWVWNDLYKLEEDIFIHETRLTPRTILKALRQWDYLTERSKGRVTVGYPHGNDLIEILAKGTQEPLLALSALH